MHKRGVTPLHVRPDGIRDTFEALNEAGAMRSKDRAPFLKVQRERRDPKALRRLKTLLLSQDFVKSIFGGRGCVLHSHRQAGARPLKRIR